MNTPIFDIIIVNYKSTDLLLRCLRSIYDSVNGIFVKIHIQDNDSTDDIDAATSAFPEVDLTKNENNLGFSAAVNSALMKCVAPYILILNPDTIVLNGFFETTLKYLEENPGVGILGPGILNSDGSVQGSARAFPNLLTALFGRSALLTRYFPSNPLTRANVLTDRSDGRSPMEVDWVSGACMAVRKTALDEVGTMDGRFFLYWEDADWCRRMRQMGWKVVYFPSAKMIHYVGGSSEKNIFRSIIEFHKSCYRLFDKYTDHNIQLLKFFVIPFIALRMSFVLFLDGIRWLCKGESYTPIEMEQIPLKSRKIKNE